jgi:two-component system cell cycle sensor histidine kinase/response regulator CckA
LFAAATGLREGEDRRGPLADSALQTELLDAVASAVLVWDLAHENPDTLRLAFVNRTACEWLSLSREQSVGKTIEQLFPTADPERKRLVLEVAQQRTAQDLGVSRWAGVGATSVHTRAVPVGRSAVAVLIEGRDALQRAETNAAELNRFLDSIIENMPAMVFMKDAEQLRFERFNRAGEELLGLPRDQLLGKSDYDFFPPSQADFFVEKDRQVLRDGVVDIPEEPIQTQHGERWLHTRKIPLHDEHGVPRHLLGVSIDITENKRAQDLLRASHDELERRVDERTRELQQEIAGRARAESALAETEEQLRQSQKMEAIGRLAGGVAHDFNNLLSVIQSAAALALAAPGDSGEVQTDLQEILLAAERAARLTRQLLAFGRRQLLEPRLLDLNGLLTGMREMLVRVIGEDVELCYALAPKIGRVRVDVGQLEQVVLNLVVNARDAMPRGGRLTIETAPIVFDREYGAAHADVTPGPHVMLAVSDTGIGMDRATRERMFEPFFTTKELGKGTGLGLSTVFGIVKQSGGSISVYSEPGRGATFKLYFPHAEERRTTSDARLPAVKPSPRGEIVLVAEDDEQVRAVVRRVLARAGYQVLEASSGSEALAVAERHLDSIDLLVTDVVMPEMGGPELAAALKARRPELRLLYMSGYTDDAVLRHGILEGEVAFIQKPLTPELLLRKVRDTLDAPSSG